MSVDARTRQESTLPVAPTLSIGRYPVWPPVVLAPMAGITNASFRRLCREFGAGLYVCEMITTRALVARDPKTYSMIRFEPEESPARSSCTASTRRSSGGPCASWSTRTSPTTST